MYQTAITETIAKKIEELIKLSEQSIASQQQAEREEAQGKEKRDAVATYENLYGDEDLRSSSKSRHQLATQGNHAVQSAQRARQKLENMHEDADWMQCFFAGDYHELLAALEDQPEVKRDLQGMLSYIYHPDYESEPDFYESLDYRMQQVLELLRSLLKPEGRRHRDNLLEQSKARGIETYARTNARLYRLVEQYDYHQMTSDTAAP